MMKNIPIFCAVLLSLAASSASATRLRLDRAGLELDPNQPIWHVSSQLCNKDQVPSGTLNYHIWLFMDDANARSGKSHYYDLGGVKFNKQLAPGQCWNYADTKIMVNYKKVPPGQYHTELVIGEWNGSKYLTVTTQVFYLDNGQTLDFIKN